MSNVLQERPVATHPFILHYISSSALMEEVPLQKATRLCTDRPILVISMSDNIVKARCCVPKVRAGLAYKSCNCIFIFICCYRAEICNRRIQC